MPYRDAQVKPPRYTSNQARLNLPLSFFKCLPPGTEDSCDLLLNPTTLTAFTEHLLFFDRKHHQSLGNNRAVTNITNAAPIPTENPMPGFSKP